MFNYIIRTLLAINAISLKFSRTCFKSPAPVSHSSVPSQQSQRPSPTWPWFDIDIAHYKQINPLSLLYVKKLRLTGINSPCQREWPRLCVLHSHRRTCRWDRRRCLARRSHPDQWKDWMKVGIDQKVWRNCEIGERCFIWPRNHSSHRWLGWMEWCCSRQNIGNQSPDCTLKQPGRKLLMIFTTTDQWFTEIWSAVRIELVKSHLSPDSPGSWRLWAAGQEGQDYPGDHDLRQD